MDPLKRRFGRLVAAHRKRQGLQQADLAEKARLSVHMVTKIETGAAAPSFKAIQQLADALGVDPAEFFTSELAGRPYERRALTDLVAQIADLKDGELAWLRGIVAAALKPRS